MDSKTFVQRLKLLQNALPRVIDDAETEAAVNLISLQKRRIFNDGKATDGTALGQYKSKYWKRVRRSFGRQVAYKDLQHSGQLISAFQFGRIGSGIGVGFLGTLYDDSYKRWRVPKGAKIPAYSLPTVRAYLIAKAQEKRIGRPIFEPSQNEIDDYADSLTRAISAAIQRYLTR